MILALALSGCAEATSPPACNSPACQTPVFVGTLQVYQTTTLTSTATPPLYKSPTPTATATHTPTPITYTVKAKDDMFGIAYLFGISPQALMTANPTVNPRGMSIGTVLIIPITPSPQGNTTTPTITVTATPAQVIVARPPDCFPSANGDLWCFLLVKNNQAYGLENVTGAIRLSTPGEQKPVEATATTLLDLLPSGAEAPLVAYFPSPVPNGFTASGEVTLALPQPANDARYLIASIQNQQVTISTDGISAVITGNLTLPDGSATANQVWAAATAFSADGSVVGVRKWEATSALVAGQSLPFVIQVYSLGPLIDHVTLLTQARP